MADRPLPGANVISRNPPAVRFVLVAPRAQIAEVRFRIPGGSEGSARLEPAGDGLFHATVEGIGAGTRYCFRLDGGPGIPDPCSRHQPDDVHGWSEVVDPGSFRWTDGGWQRPPPEGLVFYELHVGAFSPEGTFAGVIPHLPALADLGVNVIELMPVSDFPGRRNWGYDAAALFAPEALYGGPEGLRALVDAAHAHGLAVVLDVVYNHLGPEGNYLGHTLDRLYHQERRTPWGNALNFDGEGSRPLRDLVLQNTRTWFDEFHLDGLRLDSTHAFFDEGPEHIIAELTLSVTRQHAGPCPPYIFCEDGRNLAGLALAHSQGGMGATGLWSADFHHVVHVTLTGERDGSYADFQGGAAELAGTLVQGMWYTGQHSGYHGERRGTDPSRLSLPQVIVSIQNHDQVGNRAFGERLCALVPQPAYRLASALLLLAPETPLLFMGQEWAASTPFLYFTDHHRDLGEAVTEGRFREFARFEAFRDPAARARIPHPQAEETFLHSKLNWEETKQPKHREVLALYRELLSLRRRHPALLDASRTFNGAEAPSRSLLVFRRGVGTGNELVAVANLSTAPQVLDPLPAPLDSSCRLLLSTEEERFGGLGNARIGEQPKAPWNLAAFELDLFEK